LNETYILDTEKLSWEAVKTGGTVPAPRGYCTGVIYGQDKLIVYGGSDGSECFSDVFTLDIPAYSWSKKKTSTVLPSFSHTANLVGNSMLVFGGHTASENINSLNLLNIGNED
jgi:N-acetylneuraminic acid mutarotase